MGIFFKVSDKELLDVRNKIFRDYGLPALHRNHFNQSPYSTAWYGRNNLGDFTYELCRLTAHSELEMITTHISRGDRWIKIFLNVFKLQPGLESLQQLKGVDGLQFWLPPNSNTSMQLRVDEVKGMSLFGSLGHKLKSYHSASGLKQRATELGKYVEKDLDDIDHFVKLWHQMHRPKLTNWDGSSVT